MYFHCRRNAARACRNLSWLRLSSQIRDFLYAMLLRSQPPLLASSPARNNRRDKDNDA